MDKIQCLSIFEIDGVSVAIPTGSAGIVSPDSMGKLLSLGSW